MPFIEKTVATETRQGRECVCVCACACEYVSFVCFDRGENVFVWGCGIMWVQQGR